MKIIIGNHTIDKYNEVAVSLKYNSVADTWAFKLYFDPNSEAHKAIFKPGANLPCKIYHNNDLVIVGTVKNNSFSSSAKKELPTISGYSTTGKFYKSSVYGGTFIVDPQESITDGAIQWVNSSLREIATDIMNSYGFAAPVVDDNVAAECDKIYISSTAGVTQTVADYLSVLANDRNVVLSHTIDGRLLFTKCKSISSFKSTDIAQNVNPVPISNAIVGAPVFVAHSNTSVSFNSTPIYHFEPGQTIWTRMDHRFDGEEMHSDINMVGQANDINASDSTIKNPYVLNDFTFSRCVQTSGDDNTTPDTARNQLSEELRAITLSIDIVGWTLNNKLIRPNAIITVLNPECYIYKTTRWFIESVDFKGDTKSETCTINCVLPEVYNDEDMINIFA